MGTVSATNHSPSSKRKKAIRNIAWALGGKLVSLASVLLVGIIVARYLGTEQYGIMNYVVSFVAIFQVFADFGLDLIQIREEAKEPSERDKIIGTVYGLKVMFALMALAAAVITTLLMVSDNSIRAYIIIYALSMLLNTTWVTRNHFTSIVWNEYVVKTEISRNVIGLFIKTTMVLLHLPLLWFIIALLIDSVLLATGYLWSYSKKVDSVRRWQFDRSWAIFMIKQSFPMLLSGAAIIVYNRIDQLMIAHMIDQSHLGIYSVAVRFAELLLFVPTIIAQTISPMLVETYKVDPERYERESQTFMNVTVVLCAIIAILTSLASYPIVRFTFGKVYIGAAPVLAILAFKVIGDALSQTSGQLILIEGRQLYAPIRNVIGCITCVVLNLLFIRHYGIHGAAYAAIVTILVSGTMADLFIPAYQQIFRKQMRAIFTGWKDLAHFKTLLT